MANFQWPSRLLFQGAALIMFELRLIMGSYFCTEPWVQHTLQNSLPAKAGLMSESQQLPTTK
jgi:hypothetical protein